MEVRIDLFGESESSGGKWDLYGCAFFLMVARTTKSTPPYQIPKIDFDVRYFFFTEN